MKEHPSLDLDAADLPARDGDIDWDVVPPDHFNDILGPFDPAMVEPGRRGRWSLLVDELLALFEELAGPRERGRTCTLRGDDPPRLMYLAPEAPRTLCQEDLHDDHYHYRL